MQTAATDPVCAIEELVAQKLGQRRYKLWFKNATRFHLTDEYLRIDSPNLFIGQWIEKNFSAIIQESTEEVVGKKIDLHFSIDPELVRGMRRKQPDSQVDYMANHPERLARQHKKSGTRPVQTPLRGDLSTFVVGDSNRLAYTCAMSVAESPAAQYNPLFIHGGCGLGKTHLLQGICNEARQRHRDLRWTFVSGEDFTNQFVYAVKSGQRDAFRQRYRRLDLLVIDDIHFFANKRATQEEFLHTFNAIDGTGRQIVMASDAHPRLIGNLSEGLVSRFISGMVIRIDSPDYQTRIGVLRNRASRLNFEVSEEVLEYIAEHFKSNVRELEGALLKLVALARLTNEPLTLALARRGLCDMIDTTVPVIKLTDIESVVAIYFGLSPADLHTSRKTRTIALARGVAMYLTRKHTEMSYPEIGRFMGNKNHSTVILATRRIKNVLDGDGKARWMTPAGEKEGDLRTIITGFEEQLCCNGRSSAA